MNALEVLQLHLEPGMVYRRADLSQWSNAVDRHLAKLQEDKTLVKISGGLYLCPKDTVFGGAPPDDRALVEKFLKDKRFLLMTPNVYNSLGVGATQLYNETVVYNHKRHGRFKLGNRYYQFIIKHFFPSELTDEFLLMSLVDNLSKLAEDRENLLMRAMQKARLMNHEALIYSLENFGSIRVKKIFSTWFENGDFDK